MSTHSVHDAKTNLSRLIADALGGEEVIIARGKTPVVRLTPLSATPVRKFGALKDRIVVDPGLDEPVPPEALGDWGLE
jgi:antitoxin (DNA-binding transcriptional repressor) of toxin-antitoxin stability system